MKKTLIGLLVSILMLSNMNLVFAEESYTDNLVYEYPTAEYLATLDTMEEKYEATNVPSEILENLTDEELISVVLNYPYLPNIYVYDNVESGIAVLRNYFNGVGELEKRKDNIEFLYSEKLGIRERAVNEILAGSRRNSRAVLASYTTVYTPNGTGVTVEVSPGNELSSSQITEFANYLATYYSTATLLRSATSNYNCHSYAWYSTSANNMYWMSYATAYMTDGSYSQRAKWGSIYAGDKVYYDVGDDSHSGIVYNNSSLNSNNVWVTSKWGAGGLVRHKLADCPYLVGSNYSYISFWYR